MKNLKKILGLILIFSLFIVNLVTFKLVKAQPNNSTMEKIEKLSLELIDYLENSDAQELTPENIESFFEYRVDEKIKLTSDEYIELVQNSDDNVDKLKSLGYSFDEIADSQIIKSIVTKNNLKVEFLDNGIFSIENLDNVSNDRLRASVWGQAYKDYYAISGKYIFTVAVGTGFSYDGQKASYYGNFEAYYKRGMINIWQVSDWDKGHEQIGTSYRAYASGIFHYGFEAEGNQVLFREIYIRHQVECDKNGNIITEYKKI